MPSPVGHALGGLAAGWLVARPGAAGSSPALSTSLLLMALAIAPDLDLLFGGHRGPSHGLGSAALAGFLVFALTRQPRLAAAAAAAYASHILLDWMSADNTPPIGCMALWPLSREFFQCPVQPFAAISRRYWLPGFWSHNLAAVFREVVILAPMLALALAWRARRAPQAPPA